MAPNFLQRDTLNDKGGKLKLEEWFPMKLYLLYLKQEENKVSSLRAAREPNQ